MQTAESIQLKRKKVEKQDVFYCLVIKEITEIFGGDASGGNTRSHPEHDG